MRLAVLFFYRYQVLQGLGPAMIDTIPIRHVAAGLSLLALCATSGCRETASPPPPLPVVTATLPEVRDVTEYYEYTGNTEAVESVEIQARVSGELESMHFTPATDVEKDSLLFVIEQAPYQIAVEAAKANVEAAKAKQTEQQSIYDKTKKAKDAGAATEAEMIEALSMLEQAKAGVLTAEAGLQDAQLQLSYTEVKSPLAGRVGRELVDVGNLVGMSGPTPLTTVVQMDPIYVYFDVSERIVLEYLARRNNGSVGNEPQQPTLEIALANDPGDEYPYSGLIDWVDNKVDPLTGTIRVRGTFDNKDNKLFPGLFVRARAPYDVLTDAILVREDAIGTDIVGKYLLVVGKDNVIERRSVEPGPREAGGMRVILKGLSPEEKYVVQGIQKARPGAPADVTVDEAAGKPIKTPPSPVGNEGDAVDPAVSEAELQEQTQPDPPTESTQESNQAEP